jgi:hypothetical protein
MAENKKLFIDQIMDKASKRRKYPLSFVVENIQTFYPAFSCSRFKNLKEQMEQIPDCFFGVPIKTERIFYDCTASIHTSELPEFNGLPVIKKVGKDTVIPDKFIHIMDGNYSMACSNVYEGHPGCYYDGDIARERSHHNIQKYMTVFLKNLCCKLRINLYSDVYFENYYCKNSWTYDIGIKYKFAYFEYDREAKRLYVAPLNEHYLKPVSEEGQYITDLRENSMNMVQVFNKLYIDHLSDDDEEMTPDNYA